ncbi:hypothetical protein Tco_0666540 [Tanacetum coccineum]
MAGKEAKSTTRKIVTNDRADYYSGITSITVNGKNAYELKGKFLDDLHKNAFSVTHREDAVKHIEYFLKIVDLIDLPNVNQYKLRVVVPNLIGWRCMEIIDPDLLTKDIKGFKTYEEYKDDWIYEWNENVPCGYSEWPTCSWKEDGYCNEGNLPGAYIVGNTLCYQNLEWYDALKDSELKDEALRNKAIMEGLINEDDESSNNGWRRWDNYEITDHDHEEREYENEHEDKERCELFDDHKLPVCNIRRFEIIKYSFENDEEYVAVKEDKYDDLTSTSKDACRAYQEIFRMMDEGWMDLDARKEIDNVGEESTIWKSRSVGVLKHQDGCSTRIIAHKLNMENLPSQISGEFLILILLILVFNVLSIQ